MLDSVRVGGISSGDIIFYSVVLVCCKSLHFCQYVGFGSGMPGLYAIVASASIMESASSRSALIYSEHIRCRRKEVWQSYLTEDNASLIPPALHICLSAPSAWCGVEVCDVCWRITVGGLGLVLVRVDLATRILDSVVWWCWRKCALEFKYIRS